MHDIHLSSGAPVHGARRIVAWRVTALGGADNTSGAGTAAQAKSAQEGILTGRDEGERTVTRSQARALWPVWGSIALGLAFLLLNLGSTTGPRSPLWWVEIVIDVAMITLLARGGVGLRLRGGPAALAFVALSWGLGMAYELTLTVDGSGIGGVHPQTRASFLLAQGDYVMIALATLWLVRLWHLDFGGAFWLALGMSLTEGLIFTGALGATIMAGAPGPAVLMLAYYTLAYAGFVALPLLVVAPPGLWRAQVRPRKRPAWMLILAGFGLAFAIRVVWGLGWAPLATWAFALPPNPL